MSPDPVADADLEGMRAQIYRWAHRILRHHDDALDATQHVLMRALAPGESGIAGARRPPAWLRRVTINHCIDLLRSRRPAGPGLEGIPDVAAEPPEAPERRRRIARALEALTPPQRAVLTAKVYDRETFAEIARTQGISVPTAKTHYLRALRRLRDLLGSAEGNLP